MENKEQHVYGVQLKSGIWVACLNQVLKAQAIADKYEDAEVIPL
ncbi:hypothetical protein [Lacticaseibacillus pantheris]|nr:hypothetical protein [Lacticaseibacillus pantheris]